MTAARTPPPLTMNRRGFLAGLAATAVGTTVVFQRDRLTQLATQSIHGAAEPGQWLALAPLADLTTGTPHPFPFARKAGPDDWESGVAYALAYEGQAVSVFANVCSHRGCRVLWDAASSSFCCPCHEGVYDVRGRPASGPPQAPLPEFQARVNGELVEIYIEE